MTYIYSNPSRLATVNFSDFDIRLSIVTWAGIVECQQFLTK
jgi:hypothetical protein